MTLVSVDAVNPKTGVPITAFLQWEYLSKFVQSQERKTANNNPLNDSIESDIPREEEHTIKLNKKKKVVVTDDSLLNGISEKGLSRDHQVTVKKKK